MERLRLIPRLTTQTVPKRTLTTLRPSYRPRTPPLRLRTQKRHQTQPVDDPAFKSIVDNPPQLIRSGRKHNYFGLTILGLIPVTAFILGCWQIQRLTWKSDLIARFEDRLVKDPLPLPPQIDLSMIKEFDYRRIYARGVWRHDQEMLIGPRLHDGEDGYLVVTPLDRKDEFRGFEGNSTVLVNRGWINKAHAPQSSRPDSLPTGPVVVEGLLREPWIKNSFTPDNKPEDGAWYFPDVKQMAEHAGSQAVWVEETMRPDYVTVLKRTEKGVPVGRAAEVNLRNNHTQCLCGVTGFLYCDKIVGHDCGTNTDFQCEQYIFTWFSLSLATGVMMWMVVKRPSSGGRASGRIRRNTGW
ncbi:surf-like protein [Elasticomyces elasticus]|nr:surf-like protein [Elasticomyces elasticus]